MAKLTKKDVLHVAKLAKLDVSEVDVEKYLKQLSSVIDHISELSEVDTENVEPTGQTTGLENVFREDRVMSDESLSQEQALSGSDKTYDSSVSGTDMSSARSHNGYFRVGAILSERTDK